MHAPCFLTSCSSDQSLLVFKFKFFAINLVIIYHIEYASCLLQLLNRQLPIYNCSLCSPSLWGAVWLFWSCMLIYWSETSGFSGYHALLSVSKDCDCTRIVSFFIRYLYNVIRKNVFHQLICRIQIFMWKHFMVQSKKIQNCGIHIHNHSDIQWHTQG